MSKLLPSIPQGAPPEVHNDPGLKRILNPSIREVLEQSNGDVKILALIGNAFKQQHTYNGAKTAERYTDKDVSDVQVHVFEVLVKSYKNLTIEEIIHVFKSGMCGDYGDNAFFSARAVNDWLKLYTETERKKSMRLLIKAREKQADQIRPEPTEEERKQMQAELLEGFAKWIDKVRSECSELIESNTFSNRSVPSPQYGQFWYKKLIELGLMKEPETEDKNKYYELAIERTPLGDKQKGNAITKSKGWLVRDQVYDWIINDAPVRTLFENVCK